MSEETKEPKTDDAPAPGRPAQPPTFQEAMKRFNVQITDEDPSAALLESMEASEAKKKSEEKASAELLVGNLLAPKGSVAGIPEWMVIPEGFRFPRGKPVHFIRIRAALTDAPDKGDRCALMWSLTDADEKLAGKRTRGDQQRGVVEMTKQMIRCFDGVAADWDQGHLALIEKFWNEIGGRYRNQLAAIYYKTHHMSAKDQFDFFQDCYVVGTPTQG